MALGGITPMQKLALAGSLYFWLIPKKGGFPHQLIIRQDNVRGIKSDGVFLSAGIDQ